MGRAELWQRKAQQCIGRRAELEAALEAELAAETEAELEQSSARGRVGSEASYRINTEKRQISIGRDGADL